MNGNFERKSELFGASSYNRKILNDLNKVVPT